MQTVPSFNYKGEDIDKWKRINLYILNELKNKADFVFDNTGFLGTKEAPEEALFGGHPDKEGCKIWANALFEEIKSRSIL